MTLPSMSPLLLLLVAASFPGAEVCYLLVSNGLSCSDAPGAVQTRARLAGTAVRSRQERLHAGFRLVSLELLATESHLPPATSTRSHARRLEAAI